MEEVKEDYSKLLDIDKRSFFIGWVKMIKGLVRNITGYDLVDGWSSAKKEGVYIIFGIDYITGIVSIEYIGSSRNIKNRLYKGVHEVYDSLRQREDHTFISFPIYYIDTSNYIRTEKLLIKSLRPRLNKQHNG